MGSWLYDHPRTGPAGGCAQNSPHPQGAPVTQPLVLVPEEAETFGWAGPPGRPDYISQEAPDGVHFWSCATNMVTWGGCQGDKSPGIWTPEPVYRRAETEKRDEVGKKNETVVIKPR